MSTKKCTICNITKDSTKDYLKVGKYYLSYCKSCYNQKQVLRNHKATPEERLLRSAKSTAKRKGLDFDLSLEDIVIPDVCPVLGTPFNLQVGPKGGDVNGPSLDRINSYKGYTKDNVWVICKKANMCKSDLTLEQLERMVIVLKEVTKG